MSNAMKKSSVDIVLVSDDLEILEIRVKCKRCEDERSVMVKRENYVSEKQNLISNQCPSCSSMDYQVQERDIVDILDDLALDGGARLEIISGKSEDGRILKSFGGLGALLRYRI